MLEHSLALVLFGLAIGASSALTGTGGSILAVPLLMLGLNMPLSQAAPIALFAVLSASSIATIQALRANLVRYKTALLMAVFGIVFAPAGIWLTKQLPTKILNLFFVSILIYISFRMWQQSAELQQESENNPTPACMLNPATSKLFWTASCTRRLIATGSIAGILSGLFGVGGGFVIVPSLRQVSNFTMQTIIATSLAVVAVISITTVITYAFNNQLQWEIAMPFMIGTIIGVTIFKLFKFKITDTLSQRSFAILACIAAGLVVAKTFSFQVLIHNT